MNEGQYKAIIDLLTRIADSLENQRPLIIAVPSDIDTTQFMEELNKIELTAHRKNWKEIMGRVAKQVLESKRVRDLEKKKAESKPTMKKKATKAQ